MRSYLVALLLLFPTTVRGQDALGEAKQKLEDLDFPGALEASERALESPQAGPAELVEAYSIKGLSLSALDRKTESLDIFVKLLSINPDFKVSADVSPKLSAPFQQALVKAGDFVPIALGHTPDAPRKKPLLKELSVNLMSDPHSLVKQVRACYRTGSGPWIRTPPVKVDKPGSFTLPLPEGTKPEKIQYYFEALTSAGGVLARAGNRDEPFGEKPEEVAKAPEPGTIPPVAGGGYEDEAENGAPQWYQTWWFWTAVGAVVVGASVGIAVGVSGGDNGSGPKDYVINAP